MSSAAVTPNNNMNGNNGKSLSPLEAAAAAAAAISAAGGPGLNPANGNNNGSPGGPQLPQQALQNLQRILQSQLANVNPIHLQQALQRQQQAQQQAQMVDAGRKQLEQMLQQLQVSFLYKRASFKRSSVHIGSTAASHMGGAVLADVAHNSRFDLDAAPLK